MVTEEEKEAITAADAGITLWSHKTKRHCPADEAGNFLDQHTTARIVVIIDTHCLEETGAFIYKGSTPDSYEACCIEEVSSVQSRVTVSTTSESPQIIQGCISEQVYKYLSDVKGTPVHTHRSIILNLVYGASIRNTQSHHSLFNR